MVIKYQYTTQYTTSRQASHMEDQGQRKSATQALVRRAGKKSHSQIQPATKTSKQNRKLGGAAKI